MILIIDILNILILYKEKGGYRMDYAVTLKFDKETEKTIQNLIDEVAEKTGCCCGFWTLTK